jgi:hypothetical protein
MFSRRFENQKAFTSTRFFTSNLHDRIGNRLLLLLPTIQTPLALSSISQLIDADNGNARERSGRRFDQNTATLGRLQI